MPEPVWTSSEDFIGEAPQKAMEIIGLGPGARKSKTFLPGPQVAFILTKIRARLRVTMEVLRDAHAKHYRRPVYAVNENGDRVQTGTEPEVLTDEELVERYASARLWYEFHQEFVEHMASNQGFSVKAVSGLEEEERRRPMESSAGAERRGEEGERRDRW